MREQIGVAIGSVVVSMLPVSIILAIFALIEEGFGEAIVAFFSSFFWISMVSLFVAMFIGTPVYLLLRFCRLNNWFVVVFVGSVVGALVGIRLFPYGSPLHLGIIFSAFGGYGAAAYKFGADHTRSDE